MLIAILCLVASTGAAATCLLTDAFYSLAWLWVLPVSFLSGFVLTGVLAYLFLLLACAVVDPDKPRERYSRFYQIMAVWYIEAILALVRIRIHTEGLEKRPKEGPYVLMCNHLHEIDPAILLYYFRRHRLAFISKQENRNMFLVNKVLPMLRCPMINRENDREALKTILHSIKLVKEDGLCLGVFPEGYIHKQRKLQHFRPGVFKIPQKANVPVVVCTLRNTQHAVKNMLKLKSTDIYFHVLDVIPAQELQGKNTVELAGRVYEMMARDLGPENVLTPEEENT